MIAYHLEQAVIVSVICPIIFMIGIPLIVIEAISATNR